jgi:thiosulfate/3-mercaptopyruvate sulfurtransferase
MGSGALNILWARAVNDADGTFKPADQLEQLYESKGITPDREIIACCRIGERS